LKQLRDPRSTVTPLKRGVNERTKDCSYFNETLNPKQKTGTDHSEESCRLSYKIFAMRFE
jgi:hypothetical protein